MNRGDLPSGVGRSDMRSYRPHSDHYHMHFNCDENTMHYTNFKFDQVNVKPDNPLAMTIIRKAWLYCTEQARKGNTYIYVTVNGKQYTLYYESGFRVSVGHLKEDSESWMIYGRPITPYHLKWCINNRGTVGEAKEHMKMTEESIKQWVKRFW